MKAAFINETGPPEVIQYGDLPRPEAAANEVLLKVAAVAVNPIDTYVRGGVVAMELPLPFVVGCDVAGTIEAVGSEVKNLRPGQRVWGSNQGLLGRQGTFCEYAAVDDRWLYPIPDGVGDAQAAAIALVGITAWLGLVRDTKLTAGETLFVNGGAGGVGSTVVQMAKALGARVITTAGNDENLEACREMGADVAINYHDGDLDAAIQRAAPEGVNVWWETLREPNFERTVGLLAPRGRMVVMAGRDARPSFPVGPFYVKGCSLHGFAMFNATPAEQQMAAKDINRWLASGALRPRIDRLMPLSETATAHRLQEEATLGGKGTISGKLVLAPDID